MSEEKAPGQLMFPAKILEVDGFIESLLESYGTNVCDEWFRQMPMNLLGAALTFVIDYLPDDCHTVGRTIDLLENCEWSNHGQIRDTFNLAVYEVMCGYRFEYDWDPLPAEQLPVLKPSPLVRGSDGMRPSDNLRLGVLRGFGTDEDETVKRYCSFIASVPDADMRMSACYAVRALLKRCFPNEDRPRYSIRNILDDLG